MQVGTECSGILTYWGVLEIWQKRTLKVGRIRLLFSQLVHGHHALFLLWQLWNASGHLSNGLWNGRNSSLASRFNGCSLSASSMYSSELPDAVLRSCESNVFFPQACRGSKQTSWLATWRSDG